MSKLFYDHLIVIEEVTLVFDEEGLTKQEQKELLQFIDETIEHEILNLILTHLPKENHDVFFAKLARAPYDPAILAFLQEHMTIDIQDAILTQANAVKRAVVREIKKAKKPQSH